MTPKTPFTVEVNGYTSSTCEVSDKTASNTSLAGAVIRSETVKVHPEGIIRTDTESAYFCANGKPNGPTAITNEIITQF